MTCASQLLAVLLLCATLRAQGPASPSAQTPGAPGSAQQPSASGSNPQLNSGAQQSQTGTQSSNLGQEGPVPLSAEPHHRLVLQNDYVHVYNVAVPPLDVTLLHQHDLPYLYLTLGPADLVNAVAGQPEAHLVLQDGDTRYSPGHFAHLVRTDSGVAFHNITIELVHAQGTARNLCKGVMPGPIGECASEPAAGRKTSLEAGDDTVPYFETDEIRVNLVKVSSGRDYVEEAPREHALLVALTGANLDANLGREHIQFLHGGDILWMPAGTPRKVVDFLGTHSGFLLIAFKDSTPSSPAQ
jgi:hypothetical protein